MTDPVVSDTGSPGLKVLGVLLGAVVVLVLVAGGLFLALGGGDDGGEDTEQVSASEAADAEPEPDAEEFSDFPDDFSDDFSDDFGGDPADSSVPTTSAPPVPLDLLGGDPRPAIDAFISAAGRATSTVEVVLYPTYAFAEVRDPDRPQRTLDYGWREGELSGPEATTPFPGTDLNAETFPLGRPVWDALPRLVARGPERAGLPRGEVTHVIVTSDAPFSSRFLFRIYVTAPNGSDYVVATIDGRPAER